MQYPRILFITNNCFDASQSNGRTMEELFSFYPKEKIAQFFISGNPDFDFCSNYFQTSDGQAVQGILKPSGGVILNYNELESNKKSRSGIKKRKKDVTSMFVRNAIWNVGLWKRNGFKEWVSSFKPDIIFTMIGDSAFMLNIVMDVAKDQNAPILLLNTESFYFKNNNYFKDSSWLSRILYPLFYKGYKRAYQKLMKRSSYIIYSCSKLTEDYTKVFSLAHSTIYTPSTLEVSDYLPKEKADDVRISYLGNLGLNRHKSLIEIGDMLNDYNKNIKLHVFGSCSEIIKEALLACKGIVYHSPIPYSEVVEEIEKADILIHVESFEPFYIEDIKYGFTTKIADSLKSGRPLFVYAPDSLACTSYVKSISPICTAVNREELKANMVKLIENPALRKKIGNMNKIKAEENHSSMNSQKQIKEILMKITK